MTKKEIQEILKMLKEDGWDPKLCDTKVPYYDAVVPCGVPEDLEENYPDFKIAVGILRSALFPVEKAVDDSVWDSGESGKLSEIHRRYDTRETVF